MLVRDRKVTSIISNWPWLLAWELESMAWPAMPTAWPRLIGLKFGQGTNKVAKGHRLMAQKHLPERLRRGKCERPTAFQTNSPERVPHGNASSSEHTKTSQTYSMGRRQCSAHQLKGIVNGTLEGTLRSLKRNCKSKCTGNFEEI